MKKLILLLLLLFISPEKHETDALNYDTLTEMIQNPTEEVCLIDLRDEKDFGLAHLENFISQPWANGEKQLLMLAEEYGEDTNFYFLCYSGKKSQLAEALFKENGYEAVSIPFGFEEYIAACGNYYAHGATICEPCKEKEE